MNNDKVYVVTSYLDTVPGKLIKLRAEMKFWNRYLGDGYSHVSLSRDNTLTNMMSFARKELHNPFNSGLIKESIYRFNDYLKIEEGKIYLAHKLDKASMNKIIKAIEKNENARVELETIIVPSLLGGFIVSIKDNVYDASLINKLEKMKASLKGGN